MPHIDGRSGEVVIRIVYDGSPEAGKTTNVAQLTGLISLQRKGAAKSPGAAGERTEFFDWLDFSGGYLDGRRVRCQLVSVPGQSRLLHRRRYLLETADAIVFVADSRPPSFGASAESLALTVGILGRLAQAVPVGVILQANKQDLPGARPPPEVARALGVDLKVPVVGSVASKGDGVMGTFVLAVRLATDRVRAMLASDPLSELPTAGETPEALHAAMLERDLAARLEAERLEAARAEAARAGKQPQLAAPLEPHPIVPASSAPEPPAPSRPNLLADPGAVAIPQAQEISSGHVWPPVRGRATLAIATGGTLTAPRLVHPWAPAGALELVNESGWVLHSSERWSFESESAGRLVLLGIVRRLIPNAARLPEARALAVARDGARWRLWLVTPPVVSLLGAAAGAARAGAAAASGFLTELVFALRHLGEPDVLARPVPAGASGLALLEGRLAVLSLDEGEEHSPALRRPLGELSELIGELTGGGAGLREWFDDAGRLSLDRGKPASAAAGGR